MRFAAAVAGIGDAVNSPVKGSSMSVKWGAERITSRTGRP